MLQKKKFLEFFVTVFHVLIGFMWFVSLQLKPGLSYYANNPQAAANSLLSLLGKAESVVPLDLRSKTAVRVGVGIHGCLFVNYESLKLLKNGTLNVVQATAGLRALEGDASDRILQAVILVLEACLLCLQALFFHFSWPTFFK